MLVRCRARFLMSSITLRAYGVARSLSPPRRRLGTRERMGRMSRTPMALLSRADQERLRGLRRMNAVALGALVLMAVLFVVAFWLQRRTSWLQYVRAAAAGSMVGALADWFAVTALYRRPPGLPIPPTSIIPARKNEIGPTLAEFVETNFLSGDVFRAK